MQDQSYLISLKIVALIVNIALGLSLISCIATNIQPDQEVPSDKALIFARTVLKAQKKWLPGFDEIDLFFKNFEKLPDNINVRFRINIRPGEHAYATVVRPGRYVLFMVGSGGGFEYIEAGTYNPVEIKAGVSNYIGSYEIDLDWPRFSIYLDAKDQAFEHAIKLFKKDFGQKHADRRIVNAVLAPPDYQKTTSK